MNTKDAILVVAGVAVGYLLAGYLKKSKDNSVTGTTTSTGTTAPTVDQAKIDACNKQADDFMATIRPSAGADLGAIRKEKFDACMASKA
jgi:hypothetical protein